MKDTIDMYRGHPLILQLNEAFSTITKMIEDGEIEGGQGADGEDGTNGWSPILAVEDDFGRRVLRITNWVGGTGERPTISGYIGSNGVVIDSANAIDIRGSQGENGTDGIDGLDGTDGANGLSLEFNWDGTSLGVRQEGESEYQYVDLAAQGGGSDLPDFNSNDEGKVLTVTRNAFGQNELSWEESGGGSTQVDTRDIVDFPPYRNENDGDILTLESNAYGQVEMVWKEAPEGGGTGDITLEDITDFPSVEGADNGQVLTAVVESGPYGTSATVEWTTPDTSGGGASYDYLGTDQLYPSDSVNVLIPTSRSASALSTSQLVANAVTSYPFIPSKTFNLRMIGTEVVTVNGSSNDLIIGIMDSTGSNNFYPGQLLTETTSNITSSVGLKRLNITNQITLEAGKLYWITYSGNASHVMRGIRGDGCYVLPLDGFNTDNYINRILQRRFTSWSSMLSNPLNSNDLSRDLPLNVLLQT